MNRSPASPHRDPASPRDEVDGLREALAAMQMRVQRAALENSAANEELRCMNEELQAANEELADSRQALAVLNERLRDANLALSRKVRELEVVNDDLAGLLDSADVATLFLDRGLCIKRYTPAAARRFRLLPTDVGRPATDLAALPGADTLALDAEAVDARLEPLEREVGADDHWYVRRVVPYRAEGGLRIAGVVVTLHDISQRRHAEEGLRCLNQRLEQRVIERTGALQARTRELEAQHRLLAAVLDSSAEGVLVVDPEGRVLIKNPAAARLLRSFPDLPTLGGDVGAPLRSALSGRQVRGLELEPAGESGPGRCVLEVSAAPLLAPGGAVVGAIANLRDVTARKRVAEVEARLAALVRSTPAAVLSWAPDGTVLDWNEGAARLLGHRASEIVGQDVGALALSGDRRELEGPGEERDEASRTDVEAMLRHRDGHALRVNWTTTQVLDTRGRRIATAAIVADASERARLERRLAELADEQRRQLGHELHDSFGQQLSAIGLLATLLAPEGEPDAARQADVQRKLESAIDTAKRQLGAIIKGLAPLQVDAAGLVIALDELAESITRVHGIDSRLECDGELLAGVDDFTAQQLYLIAGEAAHNAVKHARARSIVVRLRTGAGQDAQRLEVEDDGIGIGAAAARTDGEGHGLRILRYRCRIIGAMLEIASGECGGTVVRCLLPTPDTPAAKEAPP